MLRQILECGNGACDIAAFGLKRALADWITPMERADAKAVISLRSASSLPGNINTKQIALGLGD